MNDLAKLEKRLGYEFSNKKLLQQACTHRSYSRDNNERLEFLGDVILSATVSEHLYHNESDLAEGELTRRRAMLVKGETLTQIAKNMGLGTFLSLGLSEAAAGRGRSSILEDALEAVIAAVFLDGGWAPVKKLVLTLWESKFQEKLDHIEKDPKTQLQEWLQARGLALPIYSIEVAGPGHRQIFKASCQVEGMETEFFGEGKTRRQAEQAAARKMQQYLEKE